MNAAIQMMNAAATQSKQRSALSPDKVAALRKELEFLVARYTEVINLMKQNQGSTK
jgi:septum formation topological specificity factor MinE